MSPSTFIEIVHATGAPPPETGKRRRLSKWGLANVDLASGPDIWIVRFWEPFLVARLSSHEKVPTFLMSRKYTENLTPEQERKLMQEMANFYHRQLAANSDKAVLHTFSYISSKNEPPPPKVMTVHFGVEAGVLQIDGDKVLLAEIAPHKVGTENPFARQLRLDGGKWVNVEGTDDEMHMSRRHFNSIYRNRAEFIGAMYGVPTEWIEAMQGSQGPTGPVQL